MLTPLVLATLTLLQPPAAAPAANTLKITNLRTTYGDYGAPRPLTPLFPGDVMFVNFDITGITTDAENRVRYAMFIEVFDAAGATKYKTDPADRNDFVPLGGNVLPGRAYTVIGFDQAPGEYRLKVTVTDLASKASQAVEQPFTVAPRDFAVVAVYTSIDERGQIPIPTTAAVGQSVFIQLGVVGFGRDQGKKPNVEVEMLPVDEQGNPTMAKPSLLAVRDSVDEKDAGITIRYLLPLTRPGKFTVRLKATDKVTGKTNTFSLPVTALANN